MRKAAKGLVLSCVGDFKQIEAAFRQKEADRMTLAQRNAEILRILDEQTRHNTVSKAAARASLIDTGIYTKKGKIRAVFGGESKAEKKI